MSRKVFLLIIESALIYLCGVAAVYLQFSGDSPQVLVNEHAWLKLLLPMVVVQGSYYLFDLYEFSLIRMQSLLALRIFQAQGLSAITLALIVHFVPQMWVGRNVFLVHLLLMLTAMSWWRLLAMWLLRNPRLASESTASLVSAATSRRAKISAVILSETALWMAGSRASGATVVT
jgi:FlaA1/EpsC-like NDP-sugar epimerase